MSVLTRQIKMKIVIVKEAFNRKPTPSRHIELAQYADDTALVATSKQPQLLLKYLETYLTEQIGRASCRKECRSRWSPYH